MQEEGFDQEDEQLTGATQKSRAHSQKDPASTDYLEPTLMTRYLRWIKRKP